jgi:peptide/nickel transport system permease protein
MGRLLITAITERDYPTVMTLTTLAAVLTMIGILISDLLYAVVDPRITLDRPAA